MQDPIDVYEQQKMRVPVLCCMPLLAERLDPLLKRWIVVQTMTQVLPLFRFTSEYIVD
jgi:hypothetical protein